MAFSLPGRPLRRGDLLLQLLNTQLDRARVFARGSLDLRLLLFRQLETDMLLIRHGVLLAWVADGTTEASLTRCREFSVNLRRVSLVSRIAVAPSPPSHPSGASNSRAYAGNRNRI